MAYGTVARTRVKPGKQDELLALMRSYDDLDIPGMKFAMMYQSDEDPEVYWMAVAFESKEAYHANANDPVQNERYAKQAALMAEEPQWHDGEIVHMLKK